ncbi:MAG: metal-dependent transcriptional regulator [Saprospiraceae bacterium]|nr:metal-dependent transcriptional regulator [Saprospiraceae bacterium]
MTLSSTEENYLKAIFKIAEKEKKSVSTNSLARQLGTTPASVTDMIKRLAGKDMINYEKYKGVTLSGQGNKFAINIIRKHRLWELFLVNKLRFAWHQVHDIAEELEHVISEELISRLDAFMDYPKFDPHGDPIPNPDGKFTLRNQVSLSEMYPNQYGVLLSVKDQHTDFLKFLTKINIKLGSEIRILEMYDYDRSIKIIIDAKYETTISKQISQNLLMKKS